MVRGFQKIEQSESNRQKTLTLEQKLQLQGESFSELSKLYIVLLLILPISAYCISLAMSADAFLLLITKRK